MIHRILKLPIFLLLGIAWATGLSAQNQDCTCQQDIEFLNEKIRLSPAFKDNRQAYEATYQKVSAKLPEVKDIWTCYTLMNQLTLSTGDNHMRIYGIVPEDTDQDISTYIPQANLDIDSLQGALHQKPFESIEGIYSRKNVIELGIYKVANQNKYHAIVLESSIDLWKKGDIMYTFLPYGQEYLLGFGGQFSTKRLIAYTERISEGTMLQLGLQKKPEQPHFSKTPYPDTTYLRKELSPTITYLKVGSFSSYYPTLGEAESFYQSLKNTLDKKHLIVDLRNNTGGGDRNSKFLRKILKKYAKKNKVYILINHSTKSNAEQFTYRMAKRKNVSIMGDRTGGAAAFEIKNSTYDLPCNNFIAILTSKKHSKFLGIESKGIEPDHYLAYDKSWIEQVVEYID